MVKDAEINAAGANGKDGAGIIRPAEKGGSKERIVSQDQAPLRITTIRLTREAVQHVERAGTPISADGKHGPCTRPTVDGRSIKGAPREQQIGLGITAVVTAGK